jgi:hypothetical protein
VSGAGLSMTRVSILGLPFSRGMPGRSANVSLTPCSDSSGAVAAVLQLNAGADGTLYAREPADGLCVLRIAPFGEA